MGPAMKRPFPNSVALTLTLSQKERGTIPPILAAAAGTADARAGAPQPLGSRGRRPGAPGPALAAASRPWRWTVGSLSHAWFECIGWLEDGEPTDAALEQIAPRQETRRPDLPDLIGRFRECLRKPAVAAALRRALTNNPPALTKPAGVHVPAGVKDPHWEVFRERSFAVADEDGILQGRVRPSGGAPRWLTDHRGQHPRLQDRRSQRRPRAIEARVEHYRPQLEAYRRAAARILAISPAMVSARLLFVGPAWSRGLVRMRTEATYKLSRNSGHAGWF